MVSDNPESFADLDGHQGEGGPQDNSRQSGTPCNSEWSATNGQDYCGAVDSSTLADNLERRNQQAEAAQTGEQTAQKKDRGTEGKDDEGKVHCENEKCTKTKQRIVVRAKPNGPPSPPGFVVFATAAAVCLYAEPCGAALAAAAAFGAVFIGTVAVVDLTLYFSKGGDQNILPSWAEGERPLPGESAKDFARRLSDAHHGAKPYPTGPGSEFSKIKKWARDKFGI
jgi:hypothetical protein